MNTLDSIKQRTAKAKKQQEKEQALKDKAKAELKKAEELKAERRYKEALILGQIRIYNECLKEIEDAADKGSSTYTFYYPSFPTFQDKNYVDAVLQSLSKRLKEEGFQIKRYPATYKRRYKTYNWAGALTIDWA